MRHLGLNLVAYLSISVIEYVLAEMSQSQTLRADAFNNLSGIVSSLLLMLGLHIARDTDDDAFDRGISMTNQGQTMGTMQRVRFTRFRAETIFTLVTGIIMIGISLQVIYSGIRGLINPNTRVVPQPVALIGAAIASVIMLIVWYLNRQAGRKLKNAALTASAQDSLSDAFTSIGTFVSIGGALLFNLSWLDGAASIVVGLFILFAGLKIFLDSSLNLADYFDPRMEATYRDAIEDVDGVRGVGELKAHYNGNLVTLDVMIYVDAEMNILDSYGLSERIERLMRHRYGITDTDVAAVPDPATIHKHKKH
ncbi:cation diffusion facilitator family transporter [Furfurilactobacillus milii]|uniref:Cation diffusion facilitator family transporter n=1 Tax=Furfurilactobacillus rossiae TaxID=231049 RepID=A0A7C9J2B7_9LACO|nr:cation diffusion facilitator family transporter [Furfurilactobacillus milii]MYV06035.1 cation diffusion facilitator family transporter [Furfurilactobacillus milii]